MTEQTKPRIWRWHGVWHCVEIQTTETAFHVTCGLGYTPEGAHADWLRMKNKYPEAQADSCVQLKG